MSRCIVDSCPNRQCNGRGWCWKHYTRWRRGQRIEDATLTEILSAGVGAPDGLAECWQWGGHRNPDGYGLVRGGYAHRAMMSLVAGRELDSDEHVCHHCDNPPCVNPRHLFIGSASDNMRDMVAKGRHGGRYYNIPERDVRWLYERHVSPDRIAAIFDVSAIVIRLRVRELGLPSRGPGRPTRAETAAADRAEHEYLVRQSEKVAA